MRIDLVPLLPAVLALIGMPQTVRAAPPVRNSRFCQSVDREFESAHAHHNINNLLVLPAKHRNSWITSTRAARAAGITDATTAAGSDDRGRTESPAPAVVRPKLRMARDTVEAVVLVHWFVYRNLQ